MKAIIPMTVRIPKKLHGWLKREAEKRHTSRHSLILQAIQYQAQKK